MYFIFADGAVKAVDMMEWARWMEQGIGVRRVAVNEIGDVSISTVFLGLDHNFSVSGPPILFETMVFGGPLDQLQERYTSIEEALLGHALTVERVKNQQA